MRSTAKVDIMNQVLAETPHIGALYAFDDNFELV